MEEVSLWIETISSAASRLLGQFVEFLPTLVGAVVVLALGWLIARMLRSAATGFFSFLGIATLLMSML